MLLLRGLASAPQLIGFGLTRFCVGARSWVIMTQILLTLILCSQIHMNNFLTESTTVVDIFYSNIYKTVLIWTAVSAANITTRHLYARLL